ncbi:MAG: helix-turn-helix domain-containing protein [Acidobacteria bacterium]|nr:helix-turn-helix domain-containing protein [Acidobacteriota bacterium]
MGDLGQRLRREREARGVPLHDIAQQTRIGVRLLQAIEEEAFDQLPGGIFNKSFIRQYAQYLGLDEEQAVRDYLRATAATSEAPTQRPQPEPRPPISFQSIIILRLALGAAAMAIIISIVWFLLPRPPQAVESRPRSQQAPTATSSQTLPPVESFARTTAPSMPPAAALDPLAGSTSERSAGDAGSPALSTRQEAQELASAANLLAGAAGRERLAGELPEELLLQINARSTVWISITADGEKQWQGTMQPNQSREVQAVETIRLTVGNAGGVELTLNGKALGALGGEGEVKTVTLAARALQEAVP